MFMDGSELMSAADTALAGIRTALQADGYDLVLDAASPRELRVAIDASAEACGECLIPMDSMRDLIESALAEAGVAATVDMRYPAV
jgi:hypothetical protein